MKKIILILILIIGIGFILDPLQILKYSKNQTTNLLEKSLEYKNFTTEINSPEAGKLIMKFKDNKELLTITESDSQTYMIYINQDADEVIIADGKDALVTKYSTYNDKNSKYFESSNQSVLDFIKKDDTEYKFIKQTKYNNENCIVFEIKYTTDNKQYIEEYTISKKTGMVYQIDEKDSNNVILSSTIFNVTLNNVTDDDVARPDLTNLKVYNI